MSVKQGTKISPNYENAIECRSDPGNKKPWPKCSELEGGKVNRTRERGGTMMSEKWGERDKGGTGGRKR